MQKLLTLLQIVDSMFPIGGFTQSYGLESFVADQVVHDNATAAEYVRSMLEYNVFYNDAAFLHKAWCVPYDKSYRKNIQALDELATSSKGAREIREASQKLAIRFLKLAVQLKAYPVAETYLKQIQQGALHGHYAIAFGIYAKSAGITRTQALTSFYFNALNSMVTNSAKIVPVSQTAAQKILYDLQPLIGRLVRKQHRMDDSLVGLCCIGQEIKCMQHEKLYSRIYIS